MGFKARNQSLNLSSVSINEALLPSHLSYEMVLLSFPLVNNQHPLRPCEQYQKVFIIQQADSKLHSPEWKKRSASYGEKAL